MYLLVLKELKYDITFQHFMTKKKGYPNLYNILGFRFTKLEWNLTEEISDWKKKYC